MQGKGFEHQFSHKKTYVSPVEEFIIKILSFCISIKIFFSLTNQKKLVLFGFFRTFSAHLNTI